MKVANISNSYSFYIIILSITFFFISSLLTLSHFFHIPKIEQQSELEKCCPTFRNELLKHESWNLLCKFLADLPRDLKGSLKSSREVMLQMKI